MNTVLPKISIITPSFNQGQYIEQTIDSVLSQNYPNLEYIIIDGGSTDNSVEIIKRYEKYLKYWVSEKDKGQSHAINKGLDKANGEIFNWINSDDYYEPGALFKIADTFLQNNENMVVAGRERAFNSETNNTIEIYEGTKIEGDLSELIYQGIIDQPATFWKFKIIQELGALPEQLHYTMDSYWWTKFLMLYGVNKVAKINDIITNFRLHNQSKSVANQDKFKSNRMAIHKALSQELSFHPYIVEYFKSQTNIDLEFNLKKSKFDLNLKSKVEANFASHVYPRYYINRDYIKAKKCIKIAFKHYKTKTTLMYFIKLYLIPTTILKLIRKIKNISCI